MAQLTNENTLTLQWSDDSGTTVRDSEASLKIIWKIFQNVQIASFSVVSFSSSH